MKKKLILGCAILLITPLPLLHAEEGLEENVYYNSSYTIGGTSSIGAGMIEKYFDSNALVVNQGDFYFVSITLLDNNALTNLSIPGDYERGVIKEDVGKKSTYTVSLMGNDIKTPIPLTGRVDAMRMDVSFNIKLNLDSVSKEDKTLDSETEFPGVYVPTITIDSAGDVSSVQNAIYKLPEASASLGDEKCELEIKALDPEGEDVLIENNQITLSKLGVYSIIYKAKTSKYKTNLGNDSYTTKVIKVTSLSKSSDSVKIDDLNNILPKNYIVQSQTITSGSEYDRIVKLMEDYSEHYEAINISLMDYDGSEITLSDNIKYHLEVSPSFDRNKLEVYYLDGDKLINVACDGYGRYVTFSSNMVGTFIVLVPGITFHMPILGYILIAAGILLVIVGAVVVTIIIVKKKKYNKRIMTN